MGCHAHLHLRRRPSLLRIATQGLGLLPVLWSLPALAQGVAVPLQDSRSSLDGLYAGAHFGYSAGAATTTLRDFPASTTTGSLGTAAGGVLLGYAQSLGSHLYLGLEADVSFPNFLGNDDRLSSVKSVRGTLDERLDAWGTTRVRLGHGFDWGLLYGTGGLVWSVGRFIETPSDGASAVEHSRGRLGWTLGAGFERSITNDWSARLEYSYDALESAKASLASGGSVESTFGSHTLRVALNWHLPWGKPEPPAKHRDASPSERDLGSERHGADDKSAQTSEEARSPSPPSQTWNIHGQSTFVGQGYPSFRSPYQGASSLQGHSQFENTLSATAFLGLRTWRGGELYLNPELMQGFGLSSTRGVAGFPNGEAQKSGFLVPRLNAARLFFRQTFELGGERETIEDGPNQLTDERAVSRLTLTVGKLAVTDLFLVNTYAGEPRTTFLNWNIYGGGSYDWTMDVLSWTWGAVLDLNQRNWALRAGYFLLPKHASDNYFDTRMPNHGQYTAELELRYGPESRPGKLQVFGWVSYGNIGSYGDALAIAGATRTTPDVAATRGQDRLNAGFVVSAEQKLSDEFGMFSRVSWSPEQVESMGWTDCGESVSMGGLLKGTLWKRPDDTVGFAGVIEGLSPVAIRYFQAGGMGILIGDGRLNYHPEAILETYYAFSPVSWGSVTFDYQLIVNPGYNADRGPVSIFSGRLHAAF